MAGNKSKVADIVDDIRRIFQVVNEHSKRAGRDTGITGPQLWAIKTIAENAPIKGAELARRMYIHPATVVGILDRLEVRGLIVRTRSMLDRRVVEIELTGRGKTLVASTPEVAQRLLVKGLEKLPETDLSRISDGLEELVRILGAKGVFPSMMLTSEADLPSKTTK